MHNQFSSRMVNQHETIFKDIGELKESVDEATKRSNEYYAHMKKITTSPNKVKPEEDKEVPLSEEVPWEIPPDVKIAVEGGDTNKPYEYGS